MTKWHVLRAGETSPRPMPGRSARARRALCLALALSLGTRLAITWLLASATLALAFRTLLVSTTASGAWSRLALLPGLIAAVPMVIVLIRRARRMAPSPEQVVALLDARHHLGGRLMTSAELGPERAPCPEDASVPELRVCWKGRRWLIQLLLGSAYLWAALVVPLGSLSPTPPHPALDVGREVSILSDQARLLEQNILLTGEEAGAMLAELADIERNARADEPATSLEALDRAERALNRATDSGIEDLISQAAAATRAQSLARSLASPQGAETLARSGPGRLAEAISTASSLAAAAGADLNAELEQALRQAAATGELSTELTQQLAELARLVDRHQASLDRRIKALSEARMISMADLEALAACSDPGARSTEGLAAFLAEEPDEPIDDLVATWCRAPGSGSGIARGPGDAPMTWTQARSPGDAAFREQALPPASVAELASATTVAISGAAPRIMPGPEIRHSAGSPRASAAGTAVQAPILPRHQRVVDRYFRTRSRSEPKAPIPRLPEDS